MKKYANLSGKSGVSEYDDTNPELIIVRFKTGEEYGYPKDGKMSELAEKGEGLNTYINEEKPAHISGYKLWAAQRLQEIAEKKKARKTPNYNKE